MKFREVYAFLVMDEVKNGETVYVLDRDMKTVEAINEMTVSEAVDVINDADNYRDRYEFWTEEAEENENE